MHNLSFVYPNKTGRKTIETLKGPRRCILFLDYSNQGGWGMLVFLKGCDFEYTKLSIHFESSNDECTIEKEAKNSIC